MYLLPIGGSGIRVECPTRLHLRPVPQKISSSFTRKKDSAVIRYAVAVSTLLMVPIAFASCADADPASEVAQPGMVETAEAPATEEVAWTYEGTAGPEAWGTLSGEYAACSVGQTQSPIDLRAAAAQEADLPPLRLEYSQANVQVEDTGHGYQATPANAHTLHVGEDTYRLLQFHPHAPSEHTLGGRSYPMEFHFVHQNDAGELAVVGVMVEEGAAHPAYQPFVEASENEAQASASIEQLEALLPSDRSYFTYEGSLTTPPCTEGVRWIVLREPITLSEAQITAIAEDHGATNRPVQPLGDRRLRVSM